MTKPPIVSTNKPLPFGDLSPLEFERLCLWLVEREGYLRPQHLGEGGSEQGRDIVAYKPTEAGEELWYFQCKRYKRIYASTLKKEVDKYNTLAEADPTKRPAGIVFVTSAVPSARVRDKVADYCREHGYAYDFWARAELDMRVKKHIDVVQEFFDASSQLLEQFVQRVEQRLEAMSPSPTRVAQPAHLFICYKRNVEPDEPLALQLCRALREHHDVFIDQEMLVGMDWAERIQAELETCDYLIPLLSEHSVHNEMIEAEIRTAHRLGKARAGKPRILPVRVAYTAPFEYPFSAYLDRLNWAFWKSEADTESLIEELLATIAGGELSIASGAAKSEIVRLIEPVDLPHPRPAADLELPGGTMDPESRFYIERGGDRLCQDYIARQGVTITIKAPRQLGKSSLLVRTMQCAAAAGKTVVFLDFQLFDRATLESPEAFFRALCHWITDELDLADEVDHFWKAQLSHVLRCTKYIKEHVLHAVDGSLVLAMDEVDQMFDCPFRSDFFGMLRSWHNSRRPGNEWKRLDLALVISTEPYLLIDNPTQSPFNVVEPIELDDFTLDQVRDLNARHGHPLSEPQLTRLMSLIGGHPYLVRRALYLVASGQTDAGTLFANAARDEGPFGDHLRRHLFHFRDRPDLRQAMDQILAHNTCSDDLLFFRLRGAGLARRAGSDVVLRYGLYDGYFRERFHV